MDSDWDQGQMPEGEVEVKNQAAWPGERAGEELALLCALAMVSTDHFNSAELSAKLFLAMFGLFLKSTQLSM